MSINKTIFTIFCSKQIPAWCQNDFERRYLCNAFACVIVTSLWPHINLVTAPPIGQKW